MAVVLPNTTIKLLSDIPLDNTYEHTIIFSTKQAQYDFFISHLTHNLQYGTYQRVNKGVMRVGVPADSCYRCNYLMFQNTNHGDKWFYAFITSVEYVNEVTCEITYEMDVMQTWHFDYDLHSCFVEREHCESDAIGSNIVPEPIEVGEYVFNNYESIKLMYDIAIIVAIVDVDNYTDGSVYDGIYGAAKLFAYRHTDVDSINAKIDEYTTAGKPDAVVSIYTCPLILLPEIPRVGGLQLQSTTSADILVETIEPVKKGDALDGYIPRNKKLYTYPYNFYHVDNANGAELTLRYEFFEYLTPVFRITGSITQPVECKLRPVEYKNSGHYISLCTETLTLCDYPICSWYGDTYVAWIAQNSVPNAINLGSAALQTIPSTIAGGMFGLAMGANNIIGEAANILSTAYKSSIAADICKGSFTGGNSDVSNHFHQFYGGRCSITKSMALSADSFFSTFGYAVRSLKVPNRNVRPHWTYTKTVNCVATGSVPADDMNKICSIYNHGITFWNNGNEVGHYELDNTVD